MINVASNFCKVLKSLEYLLNLINTNKLLVLSNSESILSLLQILSTKLDLIEEILLSLWVNPYKNLEMYINYVEVGDQVGAIMYTTDDALTKFGVLFENSETINSVVLVDADNNRVSFNGNLAANVWDSGEGGTPINITSFPCKVYVNDSLWIIIDKK